ncbi:hypothetical protein CRG98_018389 [Punica granatum]|uniref:Uncharacterized protein n=1 Tax=Punica granatum TaxID=22663 RepID=A0A2I0JY64_PUNGR|nr:hypothetical protein CRG98_018389 [Punica granatum]
MSQRTRSSKKEVSASKQLASSQPSVGQITINSQIKTYRQTLQNEIDKQGNMQTLPVSNRATDDHLAFFQAKAKASSFLSAAKEDTDFMGHLSQVLLELKDLNATSSTHTSSLRDDEDSDMLSV